MKGNMPVVVVGILIGGAFAVYWDLKTGPHDEPVATEGLSSEEGELDQTAGYVERPGRSASAPSGASAKPVPATGPSKPQMATSRSTADAVETDSVAEGTPSVSGMTQISEGDRSVSLQVKRVLVGGQLISNGILNEAVIEHYGKEKKYIVYFELSVLADPGQPEVRLSYEDFRLEDSQGTMYRPLKLSKQGQAVLKGGETWREGVAYAIHNDGAPSRLHFRVRDEMFTPIPTSIFEQGGSRSQ